MMLDNHQAAPCSFCLPVAQPAVASAIAIARAFAEACPADQANRLAVIIEEAIANIVEHGECPAGSVIDGTLAMERDSIALTLVSDGLRFDPTATDQPAPMPDRGGGAGLALIRAWASSVTWRWQDNRNHVTIVIAAAA